MRLVKRFGLLAVLVFLLVPVADAANAFVQKKSTSTDNAAHTVITVTTNTDVGAGNLLAVWLVWGDTAKTITVTGSGGCNNTFTSALANNAVRIEVFYAKNITGGACTVTGTFSASISAYSTMVVHEISGADTTAPLGQAVDQSQTSVSGTDSVTSTAVTTTTDGEYIFGNAVRTDNVEGSFTAGTGFNSRESNTTNLASLSEDKIQTSQGSIAATFTPTATYNTNASIVTFKAASGAASAARRRILN